MRYAETGFHLEVDLSKGSIARVSTDARWRELHLGGQGTAARILWDRVPPEIAPFSPENLLIFSAGLLDGTPVPGANRTLVSTIDPQTNLHVSSGFGGFFGPELKHAGYDHVVIRGKSERPVYLWIHGDQVEIRDADHLRGVSPLEATALIRQELRDANLQVAAIGLAGENRVFSASIGHANTGTSRGVGAVMGDKGLKAIAVRGTKDLPVARAEALFPACVRHSEAIHANPHCGDVFLHERDASWHAANPPWTTLDRPVRGFWTAELQDELQVVVAREHVSYQWENYSQQIEEVRETLVHRSTRLRGTGCYNCPRDCHQAVSLPDGKIYFTKHLTRLAYAMAAYRGLSFDYSVLVAVQEFGLDEFSAAPLLHFALALHEAGILGEGDLPDFPSEGSARLSYLVERIARREGVGDALAEGVHRAARRLGRGAEAHDHTAKGIEHVSLARAANDSPYFLMYAAGEKTNIAQIEGSFPQAPMPDRADREAFVRDWDAAPPPFRRWFLEWTPEEALSPEAAARVADWNEVMHYADDALGMCPFLSSFRGQYGGRPPYHLYNLPELLTLATGREFDADELWEVATRNRQLIRAINVRRGARREGDRAPDDVWATTDPETDRGLLDAYYRLRGWNADGVPEGPTLDALGLGSVRDDLVARGLLSAA